MKLLEQHENGRGGGTVGRRLIGWKAIGQFLGCTERTARRWESERALPVHRIPGGARRSVWADSEELRVWLQALPSEEQASLCESGAAAPAAREAAAAIPALHLHPAAATRQRPWRVATALAALALVSAVAALVLPHVSPRRQLSADVSRTPYDDNAEARTSYLNARYELATRSPDGLSRAQRGFRQLVERFPERAAGWSGLAESYLLLREFGSLPDESAYPEAARAARTAITIDPRLATAWLDQAFVSWWWQGDSEKATREFATALELEPASARAHHWYATALAAHGDYAQSLQEIARARALSPDSRAIVADEAWLRFGFGAAPAEAIATLQRLTQTDPGFESPHFYLSQIYLIQARDGEFLREAETAAQLRGETDGLAALRLAQQQLSDGGRQAMLEQLGRSAAERWQRGAGSAVQVAEYRALAHDRNGMIGWLKTAASSHDHNLPCLRGYPEFAPYLSDPELVALLERRSSAVAPGDTPRRTALSASAGTGR